MLFWLMQLEIPEFVQANGNLLRMVFFFSIMGGYVRFIVIFKFR
jgi:hypothetical protein